MEGLYFYSEGKTKRVCLLKDKPADPETELSEEFLCRSAREILLEKKKSENYKYPCKESSFIKLLVQKIQRCKPALLINEKTLKPYFSRCFSAIQFEPLTGKNRNVCLPGHAMLIKPPTGDVLKELLLELLDLREQLAQGNFTQTSKPDINAEEIFWKIHERLDQMGRQDKSVSIPKLWRALKEQMSRNTFENLLQILADSQSIQLERRTTMEGLSQEEVNDCYHTGDKIYYNARRLL